MLAVITNRRDHTADWLILELDRRGTPFIRLNTDEFPSAWSLCWTQDGAWLDVSRRRVDMHDVHAIWWRRPTAPKVADDLDPDVALWAQGEAAEALEGVWRSADARWVNHPDANRRASNKPAQLRAAVALGMTVPDTVVTNVAREVAELFDRSLHGVVCKPLTHGRVGRSRLFTTPVSEGAIAKLGPEPCQFQAIVSKAYDIRVTVVGDEVFGTRIDAAGELDWRRAELTDLVHSREDLPSEIVEGCLGLTREFGLRFGAIDLCRTTDGDYTFFEINPNGQWAWIEQATGQPLRHALADLLLS